MTDDYQASAQKFEPRWRRYWADNNVYRTPNPGEAGFDSAKRKFVVLDFFPYPSGIGLHIGHPLGYIATDALARHLRMFGMNVLHAMGYDSFGLPAEQYAIQTGQHPRITTEANIANIAQQLSILGLSLDGGRTFSTADPRYFKWTQWLFLVLFDSFYDPHETWVSTDGHTTTGRAKPISDLETRLRSGDWVLVRPGEVGPRSLFPDGQAVSDETQLRTAVDAARLAYLDDIAVNWCPELGTVLSNEEVTTEGRSERGNYPVYRRSMRQWVLRITSYADRLVDDLDRLDWPTGIRQMQRDWIGPSSGLELDFIATSSSGAEQTLRVFTTRPDTIFGATFVALAPEHPALGVLATEDSFPGLKAHQSSRPGKASSGSAGAAAPKQGVFTGSYARHPITGEKLPIWVANYVLMDYGTGAVMGVPAHDERDMSFAVTHELPIRSVIRPTAEWLATLAPAGNTTITPETYAHDPAGFGAYVGIGTVWNSTSKLGDVSLDELPSEVAGEEVRKWAEAHDVGRRRVQYRLKDWLFSRQRYWGEPFPVVSDTVTGRVYPLHQDELPLTLPDLDDFRPTTGQPPDSTPIPPLGRALDWVEVDGWVTEEGLARTITSAGTPPPGADVLKFRRDTNTMPNWAGSCWYYLRYFDATNDDAFVGAEAERYWSTDANSASDATGAVDLYVGGAEHAVLHLLYARFWHKVMYDRGLVSTPEPFQRLFNQGMITADAFHDERGVYVDSREVDISDDDGIRRAYRRSDGHPLHIQTGKMGKRYKNGIPPEEVGARYTIDTLRVYEMFMGPLDASKPWQPDDIVGSYRFLRNIWRLATDRDRWPTSANADEQAERLRHRTVKRVTDDIANLRMNKAISALMEWTNALQRQPALPKEHLHTLLLLVSPFAPHLAEELISRSFKERHDSFGSVIGMPWPHYDPELAEKETVQVPVQVNSKTRAVIEVHPTVDEQSLIALARKAIGTQLADKEVIRTIVQMKPTPRIVSFVVRPAQRLPTHKTVS